MAPWVQPSEVDVLRASVYRYRGTLARPWRRGRIFVAGDAAHEMPPFVGQGMCSGFRDVHNVLWKLALVARKGAADSLLDTYEAERSPHVRDLIEASVQAARMLTIKDEVVARARDEGMRAQAQARTSTTAPDTPLARLRTGLVLESAAAGGRLESGRPMPQPYVTTPNGRVKLDTLLGNGFALIGGTRGTRGLTASSLAFLERIGAMIVDFGGASPRIDDEVLSRWVEGGGIALIRPDRYLFAVSDTASDANGFVEALAMGINGRNEK
jgi:3-(3-hydroxy-phenyl)propionate hydroxylase